MIEVHLSLTLVFGHRFVDSWMHLKFLKFINTVEVECLDRFDHLIASIKDAALLNRHRFAADQVENNSFRQLEEFFVADLPIHIARLKLD